MLTERFDRAATYARILHGDHLRKGTDAPYICHLLQVCGLVIEFGGNEDEAIAALLHDAAEDRGGEPRLQDIGRQFGNTVAGIVRENSDSLAESSEQKEGWRKRKTAYLEAIGQKSASACLVSICDKIHNARSLLTDQREVGDEHWKRFKAGRKDSLWYYRRLIEEFEARSDEYVRLKRPLAELRRIVVDLEAA